MRSPADPADVEEQPSDGGLDAEDIKFLRSLRTSATPGPSSDGEAGERTRRPSGCGKAVARATAHACHARSSWTWVWTTVV